MRVLFIKAALAASVLVICPVRALPLDTPSQDFAHLRRPLNDARLSVEFLDTDIAQELGLTHPGYSLREPRVQHHKGMKLGRQELLWGGLPIFNGAVASQIDSDGFLRRIAASGVARELPSGPISVGSMSNDKLRDSGFIVAKSGDAMPGWYYMQGRLLPVVRYRVMVQDRPPEPLWVYVYVGGPHPSILTTERLRFTDEAIGLVYENNPVTTPSTQLVRLEHLDTGAHRLHGTYARVESCIDPNSCDETEPLASPQGAVYGHYIFAPNLGGYTFGDPFAEVNAYFHITKINHWARTQLGWSQLFNSETWIDVKVGMSWYNAAFYPATKDYAAFIIFGQDVVDFSYDAQISYHEFGHAINRSLWHHGWHTRDSYGIDTAMFGLEEGLADIWAMTVSGVPEMDSYMVAGRNGDNTNTCPESLQGEGHKDAGIVAGFGWELRENIGAQDFNQLIFRSLSFLSQQSNYEEFAEVLRTSAQEMALDPGSGIQTDHSETIRAVAEKRGFYSQECTRRIVSLSEGEGRRVYGYGKRRTGQRNFPFGLQWKIPSQGAQAFRLSLELAYPHDLPDGYEVHLRRGKPVEITWLDLSSVEEGQPIFEVHSDLVFESSPELVEFPDSEHPPLESGENVYILLVSDTDERLLVVNGNVEFLDVQPVLEEPGDTGTDVEEPIAHMRGLSLGCQQSPNASRTTLGGGILSWAVFLTR